MDIDFSVAGATVINYVAEKYGRDRVAQIITFSTMAARAAIRDVGRVLDALRGRRPDREARAGGAGPDARGLLKAGAELRQAVDSDPVAKEIVDLARPLEGLCRLDPRGGVVIGAQPLLEVVLLQKKGNDQEVVTQLDVGRRRPRLPEDGLPRPATSTSSTRPSSPSAASTSGRSRSTTPRRTRCSRAATRPGSSSSSPRACARRCARSSPPSSRT